MKMKFKLSVKYKNARYILILFFKRIIKKFKKKIFINKIKFR